LKKGGERKRKNPHKFFKMKQQLNNLPILKERRKELRNRLTETERILWTMLKDKNIGGRKFRRQHSIGFYIVDFYCPSEKLVIELDGSQHYTTEGIAKDNERDEHLMLLGIKVIRFTNEEVKNNLSLVLKRIEDNYRNKLNEAK
jgi:very-short-patch-repair endonuclease